MGENTRRRMRALVLSTLLVTSVLAVVPSEAAAGAGNDDGFVYVDNSDGTLKSYRADGTVVDYGVGDAKVIGPRAFIDGDDRREVPYIDSNGDLYIIDDAGEKQQLGNLSSISPRTTSSKLAIGDWDADGNPDVFFASSESQENIYRVDWDERDETPENLGLFSADAAQFMVGSTDITGDGLRDLVFVTWSSSLYYVNGSGHDVKLTGSTKWGRTTTSDWANPRTSTTAARATPHPATTTTR